MSFPGKLYGAIAGIRNYLYDHEILRARRLVGPVVSVGNISAGGAGKTPFVILLGELLKERGIAFDVLSRGYGRQTKGVFLVDPGGTTSQFGDEPLLIARRLGCPVVVGENRYQAGLFAEKKFGPQLHILDDGFQHRSLARDLDLVLLTPEDLQDDLLPGGRLREPLTSLNRADAVVLIGDVDVSTLPISGKSVWRVSRGLQINNAPARPIVFCGIARPQRFLDQLSQSGISPIAVRTYRDHHAYSESDLDELLRLKAQSGAEGFITTEKDAVNLGSQISRIAPVAIARVTMHFAGPADALDTVLRGIGDRQRQP